MAITTDIAGDWACNNTWLELCSDRTQQALHVCDLMEALADDLPRQVPAAWRAVQWQSRDVLRPYLAFLYDVVLPQMMRRNSGDESQHALLARIKKDCSDRILALSDLDDLISDALLSDTFVGETEALGFALRGHFEPLRRDLLWHSDVLWPLASRMVADAETTKT